MTTKKSFSPKQWANINTAEQIRTVTNRIVEMGIDITAGYNRWRNIAFGISLEMGEEGRSFFHTSVDSMPITTTRNATNSMTIVSSDSILTATILASALLLSSVMPRKQGLTLPWELLTAQKTQSLQTLQMMQTLQTLQMMQTQKNPSLCQPSATK